jgi:transcriptional regulator with XRE-family HTH domain
MNTHSHAQTLGAALAARRHHLELSRAELARRCHMTVADLERIEHGRFVPAPSQAYELADELEMDPEPLGRWTIHQLVIVHPEYLAEHAARAA